MSETATTNRVQQKQASTYLSQPINDPHLRTSLKTFHEIIKSSYGPSGKLKTLQNNSGGHVTVTCTSSRLFPILSISKPILKLILAASSNHLQRFSDGGLFTALLCTELVISSLDLDINKRLLIDVYEYLLEMCVDYIKDEQAGIIFKVDFSKLDALLDIARSVIQAKVGCFLFGKNVQHISQLAVQLFLQTSSDCERTPKIQYLCIEGCNPQASHMAEGILYQQLTKQDISSVKWSDLSADERYIKTALFNISLSGDTEEFIAVNYEFQSMDIAANDVIIGQVMQICELLVKANVGLFLCQKVIHPTVKEYLQSCHVVVLDRLGNQYTNDVLELTGGRCISSVTSLPTAEDFGCLTGLEYVNIGQKTYIHLENTSNLVSTVVLCNRHAECVEEMKMAFKAALQSLRLLTTRPAVLYGAGCWETHLASYVRQQISQNMSDLVKEFQCTKLQLSTACDLFAHSLERVAMATNSHDDIHQVDNIHWHHWVESGDTCCCGHVISKDGLKFRDISFNGEQGSSVSKDEVGSNMFVNNGKGLVFDSVPIRMNGLQIAINTAIVVLSINNLIISKD